MSSDKPDVFDEDLMRELGITPEDMQAAHKLHKKPVAPEAKPTAQPAAPAPVAPKPPVPQAAAPAKPPVTQSPQAKAAPAPSAPAAKPVAESAPEDRAQKIAQDVPVQLAAVLAKKAVTLSQVMALRPGEVIDFKKFPQDPIDLVVNGKLVAKAELVMVDGRVAARILKLVK